MIEAMRGFATEKVDFDKWLLAYQSQITDSPEIFEVSDFYNRFQDLGPRLERMSTSHVQDFSKCVIPTITRTFRLSFPPGGESGDSNEGEQLGLLLEAKYGVLRDVESPHLSDLRAQWSCATGTIIDESANFFDFTEIHINTTVEHDSARGHITTEALAIEGLARTIGLLEDSVAAAEEQLLPIAA